MCLSSLLEIGSCMAGFIAANREGGGGGYLAGATADGFAHQAD